MKCIVILILLVNMGAAAAAQDGSKHMISFGRNGFGWSGAYEKMGTEDKSPFDSVIYHLNDLALNYAHRLGSRWQVGGFYESAHTEYSFVIAGKDAETQLQYTNFGLFALYNFSDDFNQTYYLGATLAFFTLEEENAMEITSAENKEPFELDDTGNIYELVIGKRMSLSRWGINHLVYSPNLSVYYKTHGRDFNDQLIKHGLGFGFQPIRFDFLF